MNEKSENGNLQEEIGILKMGKIEIEN